VTQTQKASATLAGESGLSVYDTDILAWSDHEALWGKLSENGPAQTSGVFTERIHSEPRGT
jgi:hypothetical protein